VKSLRAGRIEGQAKLRIDYVLPALIHSDAGGGIAQLGFDLIYEDFKERTRTFGVAVFTQKKPGSFASFD
jgi:(2R)-3-sulfolactate dehydrogenase (NADP+)